MTEEITRSYHALHCGLNATVRLTGPEDASYPDEVPSACLVCGEALVATAVSETFAENITALEDDCINCGQAIAFLESGLAWAHVEEGREGEADYGVASCEKAMQALLGTTTPLPTYAGKVAEPTDTHSILDLKTGDERKASEEAARKKLKKQRAKRTNSQSSQLSSMIPGMGRSLTNAPTPTTLSGTKFPTVLKGVAKDGGLDIEVDLPDNATEDDHLTAMTDAAKALFPDLFNEEDE